MSKTTPERGSQTDTLDTISPYQFDGTLKKVQEFIVDLIAEYGEDAYLDWVRDNYAPYESNPSPVFFLKKCRPETDIEFTARLKAEEEYSKQKLAADKELFETLKRKLGEK